uniref:Uncharacterized protein n=1 Tax=Acrobeloides nanus TaxID=290746 RepID=A0A914EDV9_9BILA
MSDLTDQVVLEIITFVRQQPIRKPIPWEIIVKDSCFLPSECTQLNAMNARDLISRMLVLNPDRRISIEEALKHSYVDLYEPEDPVEPMGSYDTSIETRNLNIDEWRRLIFDAIKNYEATHDVFGQNAQ